jgi:hypothetical protein
LHASCRPHRKPASVGRAEGAVLPLCRAVIGTRRTRHGAGGSPGPLSSPVGRVGLAWARGRIAFRASCCLGTRNECESSIVSVLYPTQRCSPCGANRVRKHWNCDVPLGTKSSSFSKVVMESSRRKELLCVSLGCSTSTILWNKIVPPRIALPDAGWTKKPMSCPSTIRWKLITPRRLSGRHVSCLGKSDIGLNTTRSPASCC